MIGFTRLNQIQQHEPKTGSGFHAMPASHRPELIEELYQRYGNTHGLVHKLQYWRKKYSWLAVIWGIRALKRGVDIVVSLSALILLSPLLLLVALAIKLTD